MRKQSFTIALFFLTIALSSCKPEPVKTGEAKALANTIEKSVRNDDPEILYNIFDKASLEKNIADKATGVSSSQVKAFVGSVNMHEFGDQLMLAVKGGSYRLLRMYSDNEKQHLVFRMFGDGGINYHDYTLIKVHSDVKAEDMYNLLSGEQISTTLTALIMAGANKDESTMSEQSEALIKIMKYKKSGNYTDEINMFNTLAPGIRNNKSLQLLYIEACKQVSNDKYKKALEDYASLYPNEPNAYLLMLDVYFLNHDYDKALTAVNKVDSLVKGDSLLNLFRGNIYKLLGRHDESVASYEKCFAYDPYIKNNTLQLAEIYAEGKEYDKAKAVIAKYKQNPHFAEDDLETLYISYPQMKE